MQQQQQYYTESELNENSKHTNEICSKRKQQVNPIHYDDYTNWQTGLDKNYGNFMKLTTQPQNNPFGIVGNADAMKKLELQKPNRQSTLDNPFMNVPIQDYNIPQQFGKAQNHCGSKCKKNYYKKLFQSPSDALFEREASERQFYTMPNSSVPNEQTKFAQWLYGNNVVGKTGSIYDRYGYPYTPDSLVNTGFNAAGPSNGGQVDNNFGVPSVQHSSPWVNNPNYGYGFGGVPGGVPYHNIQANPPNMQTNPMPLFPVWSEGPAAPGGEAAETVPPGL